MKVDSGGTNDGLDFDGWGFIVYTTDPCIRRIDFQNHFLLRPGYTSMGALENMFCSS